MELSEIDKNLKVSGKIEREDILWHEITEENFSVFGLYSQGIYNEYPPKFMRMPENIAAEINDGVEGLNYNTAGGRLRFMTDSSYVAIRHGCSPTNFSHMPLTGTTSFDVYVTENGSSKFKGCFVAPFSCNQFVYESEKNFGERKLRDITINFPLYSNVNSLKIGLSKDSSIKKSPDYKIKTPVVFYGSSITQGACSCRAGNTYQGFLSRRFDFDYVNLGFSGSAKGEPKMAEYISGLKMSAFVYDYDHNAPDIDYLKKLIIRFIR